MILLIDIDSKMPNLALKKIETYYRSQGQEVLWNMPLMRYKADKIYVSCIFDWNKHLCDEWGGAEIGGSGYSISKKLPDDIDCMKPKINFGFTTRGCIRNCYFCIVPQKEGYIKAVGDIYDFWDGEAKEIIVIDNNILALPEHFKLICSQIKKENLWVDFNQGLDHRLLTDKMCKQLVSVKTKQLRFAFDDLAYKKTALRAIKILKDNGVRDWKARWYVYAGEKDTYDTVYERLCILKEQSQGAYLMRDRKVYNKKEFIALSSWANTPGAFKQDLGELCNKSEKMSHYKQYVKLERVLQTN